MRAGENECPTIDRARRPQEKIRSRHARLYELVAEALSYADRAILFDNSVAGYGHRTVVSVMNGQTIWASSLRPAWAEDMLRSAGLIGNGDAESE